MQEKLKSYINEKKLYIEQELQRYLEELEIPLRLKESMIYSIQAGGKRLRPILLLASYETYETKIEKALSSAIALEMIHTYSLIHDDLPAMDDDDIRRGKPTNHKAFDEATAILAGDALLTYSFEIIVNDPLLNPKEKSYIIKMLAEASGPKGMVAGQILDMEAEDKQISLAELETIHTLKTGKLLSFAIMTGAYLGKADAAQLKQLEQFAYYLGLIFQVQDDILDVTGDESKLGKPVGSDVHNQKSTYPNILGLDGAVEKKQIYVTKALNALELAKAKNSALQMLTDHFSQREQ
ncbi:polyprenyl synthetase family protein [Virgibacillus sp. W0430]|uniref:polyprenyl synthetase family protein n=1 Tax=Virgibacillus sp. W0430 TaxID=3391580 RepID=UPI003F46D00A